uniref:C2H2-type domain-containing protein n=1 Tax=Strongyloides papillosus TaxID=174720 RepID=A0A0N5BFW2_STREA
MTCTSNGSGLDGDSLLREMTFGSDDIRLYQAKAEISVIKNLLRHTLNSVDGMAEESSKTASDLSSNISKAEELTDGFGQQVMEIQSVLKEFCIQQHNNTRGADDIRRRHKCPECGEMFAYPNLLDIHMKLHKRRYSCDICGKKYQKMAFLEKHKKYEHVRTFDCKYCDQSFATYQSMRIHENKTHENPECFSPKKNSCENCKLQFETPEELEKHKVACSKAYVRASFSAGPSPAYNPIMSPAFSVRSLPNLGVVTPMSSISSPALSNVTSPQITLNKLDTSCPFCNREPFATATSRDRHIRRFHPNMLHLLTNNKFHTGAGIRSQPKTNFTCSSCGRSFTNIKLLRHHERIHKNNEVGFLEKHEASIIF